MLATFLPSLSSDTSDSDFDTECDITDDVHIHEMPPRPDSRLWHNPVPPQSHNRSGVQNVWPRKPSLRWTHSIFQPVNLTSLSNSDEDQDQDQHEHEHHSLVIPTHKSEAVQDLDMDIDMDIDDLSSSSSDSSDLDDLDSKSLSSSSSTREWTPEPETLPKSPPEPFPILSDPDSDTSPTLVDATSPPPSSFFHRLPFASTPSPLSPHYRALPPPTPPPSPTDDYGFDYASSPPSFKNPLRHLYTNHGYSRSGLYHVRSFWADRHDEWIEFTASVKIHGGLHTSRLRRTRRSASAMQEPKRAAPRPPPLTIFPRIGDLSTLRDSTYAQADMYFARTPIWTISKMFWMFAVHTVMIRLGLVKDMDVDVVARLARSGVHKGVMGDASDDRDVAMIEGETPCGGGSDDDAAPAVNSSSPYPGSFPTTWAVTTNERLEMLWRYVHHEFLPPILSSPLPSSSSSSPSPSRPPLVKTPRFFLGDGEDDTDDWLDDQDGADMEVDEEDLVLVIRA